MGKTTGFLDYPRRNNTSINPLNRIKNYSEFHSQIDKEERQKQGARCMNCGVPFCQSGMMIGGMASGCPLHNLIPEWNDEIYCGTMEHALSRLLKTNPFPEFTGRVCPALCEAACTCGLNGDPVTVRDNEYFLIENAYQNGWIKPEIQKIKTGKKVAIIGSGPSGLSTASYLIRCGHYVTVFEREDRIGGLLMYGIPNMKLEKSVIERRKKIMEQEGIVFKTNSDIGKNIPAEKILADFDAVVLCCGAKKARDLNLDHYKCKEVVFAVDYLTASTKSVLSKKVSDINADNKNVVIVGGGDTGNDCVGTAIRQNAKSVTQLEMMPKPPINRSSLNPWPQFPKILKTDYGQEEAIAVYGKEPRQWQTSVKELIKDSSGVLKAIRTVKLNPEKDPSTGRMCMKEIKDSGEEIPADLLIIAAGFLGAQAYTADSFNVKLNERSNVITNQGHYQISNSKVFSAGDMRRGQSLVVWAIAEGEACGKEVDLFLNNHSK